MFDHAVIVLNGFPPSKNLLENEIQNASYLIGADGGANCLFRYGIQPNFIIGDLDSIEPEALKFFQQKGVVIEKYPAEKNETDSELAFQKAVSLKAGKIIFLGAIGDRLDHVFGNIGLLNMCLEAEIEACIKDEKSVIRLLDQSCSIQGQPGDLFSLQAYGDIVKGLSLKGSRYPLHNYNLKIGNPLTLSNEFQFGELAIQFKSGKLLVFHYRIDRQ